MSANETQVGGTHYRPEAGGMQHWDLCVNTSLGYLEGQISRYVTRWRKKNGMEDLQKALHYLNKLIEVRDQAYKWRNQCLAISTALVSMEVTKFNKANNLTQLEGAIVLNICLWHEEADLYGIRDLLLQLMNEVEPEPVPVSDSNKHAPRAVPAPFDEPQPQVCPHCDFGSGQRGMDRCAKCDGSGSVFIVKGKLYPNTENGFKEALTAFEGKLV